MWVVVSCRFAQSTANLTLKTSSCNIRRHCVLADGDAPASPFGLGSPRKARSCAIWWIEAVTPDIQAHALAAHTSGTPVVGVSGEAKA